MDKPVIPTVIPATGNEREVVDRGLGKRAMVPTCRRLRGAR